MRLQTLSDILRQNVVPRSYQSSIALSASKANTLVILPTGLGKTLIAILVSEMRLKEFGSSTGSSRVLVLAPTRPLVLQHKETFEKSLLLEESRFVLLTGETALEEREEVWSASGAQFVFATPETVLNDILSGSASLRDFVLVVFDESHRAVGDYAYTEVAKVYSKEAAHPLILGLTASPGGSIERVDEVVSNLSIRNVEARSEEDIDVQEYVEETNMESVKMKLPPEFNTLRKLLHSLYDEKIEGLKRGGFVKPSYFRGIPRITKKSLLESRHEIFSRLKESDYNSNARASVFGALISQSQAVIILHSIELLETQGVYTLQKFLSKQRENPEQGKSARALFKDERWVGIEKEASSLSSILHPKIPRLKAIVDEQLSKKQDSKIIVFTQYRDTIDLLISKLPKSIRFVGQSKRSAEDRGMSQKVQKEILERFRTTTEFNVLVSSSIGEEGLHVPDVDLVVFYEAVPSEIRLIQRRGRTGRTMPGRVVVLLSEDTVDEAYFYSALYKEKKMKKIVEDGITVEEGEEDNKSLLDYM